MFMGQHLAITAQIALHLPFSLKSSFTGVNTAHNTTEKHKHTHKHTQLAKTAELQVVPAWWRQTDGQRLRCVTIRPSVTVTPGIAANRSRTYQPHQISSLPNKQNKAIRSISPPSIWVYQPIGLPIFCCLWAGLYVLTPSTVGSSSSFRPRLFANPSAYLPYRVAKAAHSRSHLSVKLCLGLHLSNYLTVGSSACQSQAGSRALISLCCLFDPVGTSKPAVQRSCATFLEKKKVAKLDYDDEDGCDDALFVPAGKSSVSLSSQYTYNK